MKQKRLDDLLLLEEPDRGKSLQRWIAEGAYDQHDGRVMLKTNDGKNMSFRHGRKKINVTVSGVRVPRPWAIEMLMHFGKNGDMRAYDYTSGFTKSQIAALSEHQTKMHTALGVNLKSPKTIPNYLTHIPDEVESDLDFGEDEEYDGIDGTDEAIEEAAG